MTDVRMDLLASDSRAVYGRRCHYRFVACSREQREEIAGAEFKEADTGVVIISRDWPGTLPGGRRADDDLVLLVDPGVDRRALGRWVNQLRDVGHAVEVGPPLTA